MLNFSTKTIAAIATATGQGGVGIVRVSGPQAFVIAEKITNKKLNPRVAVFTKFFAENSEIIDEGIALFFKNPNSFTGEDVLELQGHGGTIVLNNILKRVLQLGAVHADPGEFSKQAFLNNKIDLAQAEAIADLISAKTDQAARGAINSLQGEFSKNIEKIIKKIVNLRIFFEAALDFPDEEVDFWQDEKVAQKISEIIFDIENILKRTKSGKILQEGLKIVLAGEPNAGKSTLLNALAQDNIAIVTDIPGTTRDILSQNINIDGIPLIITDTAGIRKSSDIIEQEGIKRALIAAEKSDFLFVIIDAAKNKNKLKDIESINNYFSELFSGKKINKNILIILNKIDLDPEYLSGNIQSIGSEFEIIQISAKNNIGLEQIKKYIKNKAGLVNTEENIFTARERHVLALTKALEFLQQAEENINFKISGDLIAEDLRLAHNELGNITGKMTADDLLGEIFGSFCIGK